MFNKILHLHALKHTVTNTQGHINTHINKQKTNVEVFSNTDSSSHTQPYQINRKTHSLYTKKKHFKSIK